MARTNKQKLVNYHGFDAKGLKASDLSQGEIAIVHGNGASATSIYTLDSASTLVEFASKATVQEMIKEGPSASLEALSSATVNLSAATVGVDGRVTALEGEKHLKSISAANDENDYVKVGVTAKGDGQTQIVSAGTQYGSFTYTPAETGSLSAVTATNGIAKAEDVKTLATRLIENDIVLGGEIAVVNTDIANLSGGTVHRFEDVEGDVTKIKGWAASGITSADVRDMRAEYGAKAMVSAFSGTVVAQYATSADTVAAIGAVNTKVGTLSGATKAISGYAATQIGSLQSDVKDIKGWAASAITTADVRDMRAEYGAKAMVSAFSATVVAQYATSADTVAAIGAVNTKVDTLSGATEAIGGDVATIKTQLDGIGDSGVTGYVKTKLSVVYKYKGSCTYAELTGKTGMENGDVWNVTDECTHEGKTYPAGTNFAWVASTSKWDALGGSVDLSQYATSAATHGAITAVDAKVGALSGGTIAISGYAATQIGSLQSDVKDIKGWAASAITTADVRDMRAEYGAKAMVSAFSATVVAQYATSADTVAAIGAVNTKVDTLSGATKAISGYAATQISSLQGDVTKIKGWAASAITSADVIDMRAEYGAKAMVSAFSATVVAQYATSANTVAAINAVNTKVGTLSGATEAISGYAATQISSLQADVSNIKRDYVTGATVSNLSGLTAATISNNVLDFDFSNVIIDCGTF